MDEVNGVVVDSLKKVAKGAVIVVFSTALAYILKFLHRVVLTRALPVSEYGAYALGFAVSYIVTVIVAFGVPAGLPRLVAEARARKEHPKVLVSTALLTVLMFGIVAVLLSLVLLPYISEVLGVPECLLFPFILSAVFIALIRAANSAARGYDDPIARALFGDLLWGLALLFVVAGSAVITRDVLIASYAFLASVLVLAFAAIWYLRSKRYLDGLIFDPTLFRKILLFSSTLFLTAFAGLVLSWMDTLTIGYFLDTTKVGIYNAALSFARMISFFLQATAFMFLPVATTLVVNGKKAELERTYQLVAKWIAVFTMPLVTISLFFPGVVLRAFFGAEYVLGATALQLLSLGYIVHALAGPNGLTLVAAGKNKYVFFSSALAALTNAVLNVILVPTYGINGAAIATAIAYTLLNIFYIYGLVRLVNIRPFGVGILKPLLASVASAVLIELVLPHDFSPLLVLFAILLYGVSYTLLLFFLKIFEKEDISLLRTLEARFGLNLGSLKTFLRHFL